VASSDHSAIPSVLGYQYQTNWGLYELLRNRVSRPDHALTLEMFDDVAWDADGRPTDLLQLKLHVNATGTLGNSSDDIWRTMGVWIDNGRPRDPLGPALSLITNSVASSGSAAFLLRDDDARDTSAALMMLESAARTSTNEATAKSRAKFMKLTPSERFTFVDRIYVVDGSPDLEDIDDRVREVLWAAMPLGRENAYMDLVWRWWGRVAVDMLRRRRPAITVPELATQLDAIRDMFTADNLPTVIELADVDKDAVLVNLADRTFVKQMMWVGIGPVNLRAAVIDYYRAYSQTTTWLDRHIVGLSELERFEDNLRDEWERAFENMCEALSADATNEDKQAAGKQLLQHLTESTLTVRSRYTDQFYARGKRHELADRGQVGWHPEFLKHLEELLTPAAATS